ncbi:MAG: endonuclease/exonuclease/phosphatase family protein [Bacteroidales bacterium]|nr:endonuclease/exonuclease/phosphatase family protein [Bacteroidales bacterium]
MKHFRKLILLLAGILQIVSSDAQELKLMTYNIRFANPADAPHTWPARNPLVINQIFELDPDIIGFQEVLHQQVLDLEKDLPTYTRIGVGRDDGKIAGEYSPLFFRTDRFSLSESGTFWLSDTPEQISVGWDAALPRIATWATMTDRTTQELLLVINTHFDHIGKTARLNSIKLLANFLREQRAAHKHLILMGDLNTGPDDEPYKWLMEQDLLSDPFYEAEHRTGPVGTYNAFNYAHQSERIDYILLDPTLKVQQYRVLMESYKGILPSDHWPVMVIATKP